MAQPGLIEDPRFQDNSCRCKNIVELKPIIEAWTNQFPTTTLIGMMMKSGVPCAPIQTIGQMLEHPHTKARGMIQEVLQPNGLRIKMSGAAIKINGEVATIPESAYAPDPGENNKEILSGILGLSDDEIEALQKEGVI